MGIVPGLRKYQRRKEKRSEGFTPASHQQECVKQKNLCFRTRGAFLYSQSSKSPYENKYVEILQS